jgi:hypothetical protein
LRTLPEPRSISKRPVRTRRLDLAGASIASTQGNLILLQDPALWLA